jgi:hypothetical protein
MSHKFKFVTGLFLAICLASVDHAGQLPSPVSTSANTAYEKYFPAGIFSGSPQLDRSMASWYGRTLAALSEPSLFELRTDKAAQVYRFLWLPSFDRPISVRLTINPDGSGSAIARSADKHAGLLTKGTHDSGKLILDTENTLSRAQVKDMLNQLQDLGFWSMTTEGASHGMDGAQWVLEGVKGAKYHIVDRWSPEFPGNRPALNKEFGLLCRYLLKLAGVDVKDLY